jgi:uncharacterized protein YjeT (DUF2065 family)
MLDAFTAPCLSGIVSHRTQAIMDPAGLSLIVVGVIYLVKPDIFRRWIWTKTSIAQRALSPANYLRYMRGLGIIFIIVGVVLVIRRIH